MVAVRHAKVEYARLSSRTTASIDMSSYERRVGGERMELGSPGNTSCRFEVQCFLVFVKVAVKTEKKSRRFVVAPIMP